MVITSPMPKRTAILRPFLYPFPVLNGTTTKTKGKVQGRAKIIKHSSDLSKIKVHVPPLKTQKQIVAKLSAVQEYKTQLLEQKMKLKELECKIKLIFS